MQYRTLGRTGVRVSALALGAMNFGAIGRTTQDEATAIVDAALAGGINLVDTADMYGQGESEVMVGKAIAGRRDDLVLATKAAMPMGDERNHQGGSRRWLVTALDNSLRRLGVDHVDLYQIHRWDPATSDEETLSALTDLQRAGKIRAFGSSTFPAYRIVQAQWAAREHHLGRYVTEQPSYSLLQRGIETHVLPVTATLDEILAVEPDGVFLANGPGDPATADGPVALAQGVLERGIPLFGICFGHQILGRALGRDTYKLRYGHRGINIPVIDVATGRVAITSQNHGFALAGEPGQRFDTPFGAAVISHYCPNDGCVEGVRALDVPAFSVQYHPEAAAGPHDAAPLFDEFVGLMEARSA
jgi:diketogulonate reductase-like aldo/keto reductase